MRTRVVNSRKRILRRSMERRKEDDRKEKRKTREEKGSIEKKTSFLYSSAVIKTITIR